MSIKQLSLKERVAEETKSFAIMFVYLWVLFGLFLLHKAIILDEQHIDYTGYGLALLNALVFAKVMVIADHLHLGRRYEHKPPAYSALYKSVMFALVLVGVHILETVLRGAVNGQTLAQSLPPSRLKEMVVVAVIVAVALIPFFAFRDLGRVMGKEALVALMFRARAATPENRGTDALPPDTAAKVAKRS